MRIEIEISFERIDTDVEQEMSSLVIRLSFLVVMFWMIHNIPFLIYLNHIRNNFNGKILCTNTNQISEHYVIFCVNPILDKILPIGLTFFDENESLTIKSYHRMKSPSLLSIEKKF